MVDVWLVGFMLFLAIVVGLWFTRPPDGPPPVVGRYGSVVRAEDAPKVPPPMLLDDPPTDGVGGLMPRPKCSQVHTSVPGGWASPLLVPAA